MELEDDLFFADLSRQISLLISEDDNYYGRGGGGGSVGQEFPIQFPHVPVQGYAHFPQVMMPQAYAYVLVCRRESRGTGVFIPKSSLPKRKSKPQKPHSTVTNSQNNQFNRTVSAISQIPNLDGHDNSKYFNNNKLGALKKLNG